MNMAIQNQSGGMVYIADFDINVGKISDFLFNIGGEDVRFKQLSSRDMLIFIAEVVNAVREGSEGRIIIPGYSQEIVVSRLDSIYIKIFLSNCGNEYICEEVTSDSFINSFESLLKSIADNNQ